MPKRHKESLILTAGFPCQDVSIAGDRAGLSGKETGLFRELAKIIGTVKPDWFILENVPGLISSNKGKDFWEVITTLEQFGYCVCWRILDAQYFGVAQRRKRVWIVGSFRNTRAVEVLFKQESRRRNDTSLGEVRERGLCISTRDGEHHDPTAETYVANVIQAGDYQKTQHGQFGNEENLIASTIQASDKKLRKFGFGENLVLQTLGATIRGNVSFVWQDTHIAETDPEGKRKVDGVSSRMDGHRGKALGNAIVPQVAQVIMEAIKEIESQ